MTTEIQTRFSVDGNMFRVVEALVYLQDGRSICRASSLHLLPRREEILTAASLIKEALEDSASLF